MMAKIIEKAPIPEINANVSCKVIEEIANATITSSRRMMVELTGEMDFRASDHK
jgi:hypothetical protein